LKALFEANAQQDLTAKRTQLVNALEKRSLLLSLIEEAGLFVDLSALREPDANGNENISWGAFETYLKNGKVDQGQIISKEHCKRIEQPALTAEETRAAEEAAAKRLEGVFGKMGVKQQPEDDGKLPMVGDTRAIAAMLRDDGELAALIAEAGVSSFCFVLERLGDKGVDMDLLLQELEGTIAASGTATHVAAVRAPEAALCGTIISEAQSQSMLGALCCRTRQPEQP